MKSKAIMKVLTTNEARLRGRVNISSNTIPNLENEPCEMIHILRGERMMGWNGRWLFTESGECVPPPNISKHDLNIAIYGRIKPDSIIFRLLGFKKTEADEVEDLKKTVPQEKLDAFFESELRLRYGISTADLNERYGDALHEEDADVEQKLPFPTFHIRSWGALKKHAAEMLIYADPVRYDTRVRSIRVSNRPQEAREYLQNMYRYGGNYRFKYACQLCHDTCSDFNAVEIFLHPETELDPVHLCLCPNCTAIYRRLRSNEGVMENMRRAFLSRRDGDIEAGDYVGVSLGYDKELWFTQTHFAEIRELLRIMEEEKRGQPDPETQTRQDEEGGTPGMSIYADYVGKTIRRKDGFTGKITDITIKGETTYLHVHVTGGKETGKDTKIQLSFLLTNRSVYTISEERQI